MRKPSNAIAFCLLSAAVASSSCLAKTPERPDPQYVAASGQLLLNMAAVKGDPLSDVVLSHSLRLNATYGDDLALQAAMRTQSEHLRAQSESATLDLSVLAFRVMTGEMGERTGAERAELLQKMETASTENAFYAVLLLSLPEYADATRAATLIHGAAAAPVYRSSYMDIARGLHRRVLLAVQEHGVPKHMGTDSLVGPEAFAFAYSLTTSSAIALPAYKGMLTACNADTFDQLRVDCRHLAQRMLTDTNTMIDAHVAAAILSRIAADPIEQAAIEERVRQMNWTNQQSGLAFSELNLDTPPSGLAAAEARLVQYGRSWLKDGELVAMRQLVRETGVSEQPPMDWDVGTTDLRTQK